MAASFRSPANDVSPSIASTRDTGVVRGCEDRVEREPVLAAVGDAAPLRVAESRRCRRCRRDGCPFAHPITRPIPAEQVGAGGGRIAGEGGCRGSPMPRTETVKLYYWPGIQGRGEFCAALLLEDAGASLRRRGADGEGDVGHDADREGWRAGRVAVRAAVRPGRRRHRLARPRTCWRFSPPGSATSPTIRRSPRRRRRSS